MVFCWLMTFLLQGKAEIDHIPRRQLNLCCFCFQKPRLMETEKVESTAVFWFGGVGGGETECSQEKGKRSLSKVWEIYPRSQSKRVSCGSFGYYHTDRHEMSNGVTQEIWAWCERNKHYVRGERRWNGDEGLNEMMFEDSFRTPLFIRT